MAKTKWKRDLGTSKREQGIETPKDPQNQKVAYQFQPSTFIGNCKSWLEGLFTAVQGRRIKSKAERKFKTTKLKNMPVMLNVPPVRHQRKV